MIGDEFRALVDFREATEEAADIDLVAGQMASDRVGINSEAHQESPV